jgi:hypothetical protein
VEGLAWGKPRRGHPEGPVGAHVADLLATIERWGETGKRREELRFLALVHDAFKNRVQNWRPKTGENHHAMRARRFAERYVDDERLLATIEQHDRPYSLWRRFRRTGRLDEHALSEMLERIPDLDLFLRFVELDGSTEGKNHEPIRWLRRSSAGAECSTTRIQRPRSRHEAPRTTAPKDDPAAAPRRGRRCRVGLVDFPFHFAREIDSPRPRSAAERARRSTRPGRVARPPLGRPCARGSARWGRRGVGGRPSSAWPASGPARRPCRRWSPQ